MRFTSLLFTAVGLVLAVGCAHQPEGRAYANGPPAPLLRLPQGAPTDAPPPSVSVIDRNVAEVVRRTLSQDPTLAPMSGDVSVQVNRGIVTLSGSVPSSQARERIISSVAKIPGVDGVEDHLK